MWRCYSYGKEQSESGHARINCLPMPKVFFQENGDFAVYLRKVSYDLNKRSNIERQIAQMGDSKLTHETYLHKRPAFKHERSSSVNS